MKRYLFGGMAASIHLASMLLGAERAVLFRTGFEATEGYDAQFTLAGQRGWQSVGTGGNGLLSSIPERGQQAYIGIFPPTGTDEATSIFSPINFNPPADAKIVRFSVLLQFQPSTSGGDDEFRWSVYNQTPVRLFSIDFFTKTRRIYYELQDRNLADTGWEFAFASSSGDGLYTLEIWLDFGRNSWTALLNGFVLAHGQKIAQQQNTALNLGDIDAVWALDKPGSPGNNAMIFDNYEVVAEPVDSIPAQLEIARPNAAGNIEFQMYVQPGVTYSVDVTSNFQEPWPSLAEFTATETRSLFEDTTAKEFANGFYRLRALPPR